MRVIRPEIIFEDKEILVLRKPAGTAVQTKQNGTMDMMSIIKNYRASKGEQPYVGLVHRLDQPVEGIMVFAKNAKSAASLSKQISEKSAIKQYFAVVHGIPSPPDGVLTDYLKKDGQKNMSAVVAAGTSEAKKATLSYETQKTSGDKALLKITLDTGRHHQIRVQLSHAGWPLCGDRKYGILDDSDLALCSCRIGFVHPTTGEKMDFEIVPSGNGFAEFFS